MAYRAIAMGALVALATYQAAAANPFSDLLAGAAAIVDAQPPSRSGDYVAVINTLTTQGTFKRDIVDGTGQGITATECDLRRRAWLAEYSKGFDLYAANLAKGGKYTSYSVTCELKPG